MHQRDWQACMLVGVQEVAKLEAEKEQRLLQKEALLAGRGSLQEDYDRLKEDLATAAAVVQTTEKELASLAEKVFRCSLAARHTCMGSSA